jgi:undecaprenyl-diphosphatase
MHLTVALALFCGEWLIWCVPASLALGWLGGSDRTRKAMLVAAMSGILALLVNQCIGLAWPHPRPFMIDLGHTLIPHVADSSFPSDHLTLWWAFTFSTLARPGLRRTGMALALLGLPMAWARIYLGVHFPFDMAGAAAVAACSTWLAMRTEHAYVEHCYRFASQVHRHLFGRLIASGWLRG